MRVLCAVAVTMLAFSTAGTGQGQDGPAPVDPLRGPVDLGLTDPGLVGAIDVHMHLDPDAPGSGGQVRGIDAFDEAAIARARGLRGFVFKTHQDPASAGVAYLLRTHAEPGFEAFGRMALNYATGGINVAAVEHFSQIKGGWGRIVEMPTRDSVTGATNMDPAFLAQNRPWMLLMPPGTPPYVAVSTNGQLLPDVKFLIAAMAKMRTVDSNGKLVLATGHATNDEHLLLATEARRQGLQVLLTHGHRAPVAQQVEAAKLGAYIEYTGLDTARRNIDAALKDAVANIHTVGAEHIIFGTDCGQTVNPLPTDCMVLTIKALRARGITEREINLMYKENPARLLGLEVMSDVAHK